MNEKEKFEIQFGVIRGIQDEPARCYLLGLASDCFHKRLDENPIQIGALITLLADRIIDIEKGNIIPRDFTKDFDGDVLAVVKVGKKNKNPYEDLSAYGDGYEEINKRFV